MTVVYTNTFGIVMTQKALYVREGLWTMTFACIQFLCET